jgi:hypothetical protein
MAEDPAQRFSWGWRMRCHMLERLSRAELNPEPYQPIYIRHATGGRLRVKIVPLLPCVSLSGFLRVVFICTNPFTIESRATNMSHFYSIEFNGTEGPTSGVEERTKSTASMCSVECRCYRIFAIHLTTSVLEGCTASRSPCQTCRYQERLHQATRQEAEAVQQPHNNTHV